MSQLLALSVLILGIFGLLIGLSLNNVDRYGDPVVAASPAASSATTHGAYSTLSTPDLRHTQRLIKDIERKLAYVRDDQYGICFAIIEYWHSISLATVDCEKVRDAPTIAIPKP